MRVAIVGSGIAGLTAGWLLNRAGHEVTLLERQPESGLETHSVKFCDEGNDQPGRCSDQDTRADIPLRMFNQSLWPNLFALYQTIGVEIEPVDAAKTFAEFAGKTKLKLGPSWVDQPFRFLWQRDSRTISRDIRRLLVESRIDVSDSRIDRLDFYTYLSQRNYSQAFIFKFLFPSLASTVCTCSYDSLKNAPANVMLNTMLMLTNGDTLFRVRHGVSDVSRRLTHELTNVHFDSAVVSSTISDQEVSIQLESGAVIGVDHLIIATQANSATRILPSKATREATMLKCFTYEDVEVVMHHDERLMPINQRDWSNFNIFFEKTNQLAMCSVWMNRYYPDWKIQKQIFQTIMPFVPVAEEKVVCRRRMQRPVVNRRTFKGLDLLTKLHQERERRVWFCGSYASPGVPLLESGVVSAMSVVDAMKVALPDKLSSGEFVAP